MCKSYKVKIEKVVTKSRGFLVKGLFSKVDYNLIHSSKVGDNFLEMTCKIETDNKKSALAFCFVAFSKIRIILFPIHIPKEHTLRIPKW